MLLPKGQQLREAWVSSGNVNHISALQFTFVHHRYPQAVGKTKKPHDFQRSDEIEEKNAADDVRPARAYSKPVRGPRKLENSCRRLPHCSFIGRALAQFLSQRIISKTGLEPPVLHP